MDLLFIYLFITAVSENLEKILPMSKFDPMLRIIVFGLTKPNCRHSSFWKEIHTGTKSQFRIGELEAFRLTDRRCDFHACELLYLVERNCWGKAISENGGWSEPEQKKLISLKVFGNSCKSIRVHAGPRPIWIVSDGALPLALSAESTHRGKVAVHPKGSDGFKTVGSEAPPRQNWMGCTGT
jgi:hypothetical protein